MKHRLINPLRLSLLTAAGLWILTSCSDNSITGPPGFPLMTQAPSPGLREGIPTSQINWVVWKPRVVQKIITLDKWGFYGKLILADQGGTVGGDSTFGNHVEIPEDALPADTYITVDVLCVEGQQQCGAGVTFLPSMKFLEYVTVTLSWAYLDFPELDHLQDLLGQGKTLVDAAYQAHLNAKDSGSQASADAAAAAAQSLASHAQLIANAIYALADAVARADIEDAASFSEAIRDYGKAADDKVKEAAEYAQKAREAANAGDVTGASDYADKTHDAGEDVLSKGADASEKSIEDVYNDVNLNILYSEDGGSTWFYVEDPDVDFDNKTVSVRVNHFTRFAWAL